MGGAHRRAAQSFAQHAGAAVLGAGHRAGTAVDLWLIHTQEGNGDADSLANFLISTQGGPNPVSYHYTVSEDLNDHGVTVVDVVDTDQASWSALNANDRSINLCFAGSRVAWTREQWMQQSKAIEAAAYLCVQDCNKYGISKRVITPPYDDDPPGISDHRYVTEHLGIGSHSDVGDNFPWDVFAAAVTKYAGQPPPPPAPVPAPPGPGATYTVQPGDSLWSIAEQFHTTVDAILQENPAIVNPDMIYPGQIIQIPSN